MTDLYSSFTELKNKEVPKVKNIENFYSIFLNMNALLMNLLVPHL